MAEHVTKEQIIDWFRPYGHLDKPIPFETLVSDLRGMKAADVEPVQQWIPVTERLPVIGRSVIAYNAPAKCAAEAMYKGEGRFLQFRWEARLQDQEVTHWMPLPEPPKGE